MNKVKRIFNIYGRSNSSAFSGNVYDVEGVSPTITTCEGGNRQPLIIQEL